MFRFCGGGGGSVGSTIAPNITTADNRDFGRATRRETADGAAISEEPLLIKTPNAMIRSLACVNPNAAQMLNGMNRLSQQAPVFQPTTGMATTGKKITCSDVLNSLELNGDDAHIWNAAPPISDNKDDYGKISWVLTKQGVSKATPRFNYQVFDIENNLIGAPYPDITLDLEWVPVKNAGYWNAVRSSSNK